MRLSLAATLTVIIMLATFDGLAAGTPSWPLAKICAQESDRAACFEFESIARHQVSGPWQTLPAGPRDSCVAEISSFEQPSYRLLQLCIQNKIDELWRTRQKPHTTMDSSMQNSN
ncbi:MAG: hypothetical protein KJ587_07570 [Alphaproteobacteria bacterium]|nr:hypothetical protein [Alphaproteobacteria bacterium]